MSLVHIASGDGQVALDHRQVAVPQNTLLREDITIIAQVGDRERMPKSMGMGIGHPGPFASAPDEPAQTVLG